MADDTNEAFLKRMTRLISEARANGDVVAMEKVATILLAKVVNGEAQLGQLEQRLEMALDLFDPERVNDFETAWFRV